MLGTEFAVQVQVERLHGLVTPLAVAVVVMVSHGVPVRPVRLPSRQRGSVDWRSRTTASEALFFPCAAGSSPCPQVCPVSRLSHDKRTPRRRPAAPVAGSSLEGTLRPL